MTEENQHRPPQQWRREEKKPVEFWMPPDEEAPEVDLNAGLPYAHKPRLVVFGGSFDPVHIGHIELARKILEHGLGDEVLFIPAKQSPLKGNAPGVSGEERLEMIQLAINDALREKKQFVTTDLDGVETAHDYNFSTSDLELKREGGKSYTIDTLDTLRLAYPGTSIYFLIGTDCLAELKKWHRYGELLRQFDFLVYPRPGELLDALRTTKGNTNHNSADPAYMQLVTLFGATFANKLRKALLPVNDFPVWDISSTDIRRAIANGGDPSQYLSPSVWKYITDNKFYR